MLASTVLYDVLMLIAAMLIIGVFFGRLTERFAIPSVSGYLLVGVLFGVVIIFIEKTAWDQIFLFITTICLGFIAFDIGLERDIRELKGRRREVVIVTLTQAFTTFIFTWLGLFVLSLEFHVALILGAVAIATEPGPILFLTKRYKSKGELTETLVPLHGIEDAFSIIIFGIALSYAYAIDRGPRWGSWKSSEDQWRNCCSPLPLASSSASSSAPSSVD